MSKFKVGDEVKFIYWGEGSPVLTGTIHTIGYGDDLVIVKLFQPYNSFSNYRMSICKIKQLTKLEKVLK